MVDSTEIKTGSGRQVLLLAGHAIKIARSDQGAAVRQKGSTTISGRLPAGKAQTQPSEKSSVRSSSQVSAATFW
jgi:hypothetical protein